MTILYQNNFDAETVGVLPTGFANKNGTWVVTNTNPVSGANALTASTNVDGNAVLYTALSSADMSVETRSKAVLYVSKYPIPGHLVRMDAAYLNGYAIVFSVVNGTTCSILIFKRTAGAFSLLKNTTSVPLTLSNGQTIGVKTSIIGSAISVKVWNATTDSEPGSPQATHTDTTFSAAGHCGVYHTLDGAASCPPVDDIIFDDTVAVAGATAVTMSGPTSGAVGAASTNFTVGANGAITGTVIVTPSDGGGGGSFSPTTVSISAGTPTGTFTYTPGSAGTKTISVTNNGALSNPANISYVASVGASKPPNSAGIIYSPYNWDVNAGSAKSINPGAYFKTLFSGASCTLTFDMTNVSNPKPRVLIRVDRRTFQSVELAASIVVSMPADQGNTTHLLEVIYDAATETVNRWNAPQNTAVVLSGITLASGSETLTAPEVRPDKMLCYGDSITEGVRTLALNGAVNDLDRNCAFVCWPLELGNLLNCEVGVVGLGATGISTAGSGNVPALYNSYALMWAAKARDFSTAPKYCIWLEGTNDGVSNTQANGLTAINGMIAAMPATKFALFRPLNGTSQEVNLQAIASGCSDPSRVSYISTAGYWTGADGSDSLHPYGYADIAKIAPKMAAGIKGAFPESAPGSSTSIFAGTGSFGISAQGQIVTLI